VVGYWNPKATWWQPAADVRAKFGGEAPALGEVFWFPIRPGAALPTRVTAVGDEHYELDANYGVLGAPLDLHVQLVRLARTPQGQ
jgi:hypothetical protein